jgi:hypothetical protein
MKNLRVMRLIVVSRLRAVALSEDGAPQDGGHDLYRAYPDRLRSLLGGDLGLRAALELHGTGIFRGRMGLDYLIGCAILAPLALYLLYALVNAQKF